MLLFLHKCINYGYVAQYAYAYRCLFTFTAAETAPKHVLSCSWNKTETRFCLTVNNFPKSRLFANIIVFELFDLPKSRLKFDINDVYSVTAKVHWQVHLSVSSVCLSPDVSLLCWDVPAIRHSAVHQTQLTGHVLQAYTCTHNLYWTIE